MIGATISNDMTLIFSVIGLILLMYAALITVLLGPKATNKGIKEYVKDSFFRDMNKMHTKSTFYIVLAFIYLLVCVLIILQYAGVIDIESNNTIFVIIKLSLFLWIFLPVILTYHLEDRK